MSISDVEQLISLSRDSLQQLTRLYVYDKLSVDTDKRLEEVFKSLSSLSDLSLRQCESLRFLGEDLGNLPTLEWLVLYDCQQFDLSINEEELPWKNMKGLLYLYFNKIPKLVSLPSGLQHLAQLPSLWIGSCAEFKELPEWISCLSSLRHLILSDCPKLTCLPGGIRNLTSLRQLEIINCPRLTEVCRAPNGTEWPKI